MTTTRATSQPQARIVPWRNPLDLVWVKNAFYPGPGSLDQRNDALVMVQAWSVRSKLPHSVEATAMLTEAVIHDHASASQLHLQLSYSTAICRFVNGLLDPAQQSSLAVSMHSLARNINLPASFVEIRHASTHENLPSLAVLRMAASRALSWLWSNYWVWVGAPNTETGNEEEPQDVNLSRSRLLLKQWRKLRRESPTRTIKAGENVLESGEALAIIKGCVAMCSCVEGLDGLIEAFLEEKALIPRGKKKSSSLMKGAFSLWLPLLERLDSAIPTFSEQLVMSMLENIKSPPIGVGLQGLMCSTYLDPPTSSPQPAEDTELNKALVAWIKQFTGNSPNARFGETALAPSGNTTLDIETVARKCFFSPNKWKVEILDHILKCHPSLNSKYHVLASLAKDYIAFTAVAVTIGNVHGSTNKSTTSKRSYKRSIQEIEDELAQFEERLEQLDYLTKERLEGIRHVCDARNADTIIKQGQEETQSDPQTRRWKEYQGVWIPMPIGVIQPDMVSI